jgi:hypothetical protein
VSTATRRAIYGKLSGDSTLNNLLGTVAPGYTKSIYHGVAPDDAGFAYVLFNKQSGTPTEAFYKYDSSSNRGPSAFDTDIWLVKGVDRAPSADRAESIADRIHALLNDGTGISISGGTLAYLRRESDVDYGEVIEGVQYRHAGALYRLVYT